MKKFVGMDPNKWNVVKDDGTGRWFAYAPMRLKPAATFRGWHAAVLYALHNAKPRPSQGEAVERIITRPSEVHEDKGSRR